jgi:hypothetical protein
MLVNVITRYPPPLPDILLAGVVENQQQFGLHLLVQGGQTLRPNVVTNDQQFGNSRIARAPVLLAPSRLINNAAFGAHAISPIVQGTHGLSPVAVINTVQFGSPDAKRAPEKLLPAVVINASQFGLPIIGEAPKRFSYANALGSGNRTGSITVTTSGGTTFDTPSHLVNGDLTDNVFWGFGPIAFKFDLGAAKIVRQARWRQDTSTTHNGLFQWQGSNDDSAYIEIGGTFNLGGAPVTHHDSLLGNDTAYRWYRLQPTADASISGTPYLREVEFYIEGEFDGPAD